MQILKKKFESHKKFAIIFIPFPFDISIVHFLLSGTPFKKKNLFVISADVPVLYVCFLVLIAELIFFLP